MSQMFSYISILSCVFGSNRLRNMQILEYLWIRLFSLHTEMLWDFDLHIVFLIRRAEQCLYADRQQNLSFLHFTTMQCRSCWLNIWQTHHEKRWNSLHIVCEEDQRGRDFPQLRHEFVRSAPFLLRLSVSLAPQSVLLRYIHCHVLLLTTFRDGKCL